MYAIVDPRVGSKQTWGNTVDCDRSIGARMGKGVCAGATCG